MHTHTDHQPLPSMATQWLRDIQGIDKTSHPSLSSACYFVMHHDQDTAVKWADTALEQGIQMAKELMALRSDPETLTAAILYPIAYYGKIDRAAIKTQFGHAVYRLLLNTQSLAFIQPLLKARSQKQIDQLRKMLLAAVDDARIVLVLLAECVVALKYLQDHPSAARTAFAQQTIDVYAVIANRLGIGQLKWQLEDLAFRYLQPEAYEKIKEALQVRRSDREQYIAHFIQQLTQLLQQAGIEEKYFHITGRAKHIYSIYNKMQNKQLDFERLYDTMAFRILVPEVEHCYKVLSILHDRWPHVATEFDDYIAKPKANGYQSIHTVIQGSQHYPLEIQIRTHQMHREAELGLAAHWKYKEGGAQNRYESNISRLRQMLHWQQETTTAEHHQQLYAQIFKDHVYVLTPRGDIFDLPTGATPLDFAYLLHTEIGHRCCGAQVNGKLVPLTYRLKTGDCVTIRTTKTDKPSRDWLNPKLAYLTTPQAIRKVRYWFRKANHDQQIAIGETLWDKHRRREHWNKTEIEIALTHFQFSKLNQLLAAIGRNDMSIGLVVNYIKKRRTETQSASTQQPQQTIIQSIERRDTTHPTASEVLIEGMKRITTEMAQCCQPVPNESIIAYMSRSRGIMIHQRHCPNVQQAIHRHPKRQLKVCWGRQSQPEHFIGIVIDAEQRPDLLRDITRLFTAGKISLLGMQKQTDPLTGCLRIYCRLSIEHLQSLDAIFLQLREIPAVFAVNRQTKP